MSPTVVLISGTSRGLGRAIFERYIARPNHIVIAANRNPTDSNSQELLGFKTGEGSKAILVKVDANVDTDAAEAIKELEAKHNVDHIDIVYANAGIATIVPKASAVTIADLKAHMQANVYGLVTLLQATLPLLKKGTNPKWVTMGSQSGYLTNFLFFPNAAYGPSKVAAHWLTRALHDEEPWLTSIVIDPGYVSCSSYTLNCLHLYLDVCKLTLAMLVR
jgi:NAD(P)-dependent dehydrogenase (short-subunit alcohol dehydrogenase family)